MACIYLNRGHQEVAGSRGSWIQCQSTPKNILRTLQALGSKYFIYIYFFNQRSFGRMVGRTLGMFKRPQKRAPKRIMSCMLKILILIGENKYHILELMEVEMIS